MKTLYLDGIKHNSVRDSVLAQTQHRYIVTYAFDDGVNTTGGDKRLDVLRYQYQHMSRDFAALTQQLIDEQAKQSFVTHFKSLGYDTVIKRELQGDTFIMPLAFKATARYGVAIHHPSKWLGSKT